MIFPSRELHCHLHRSSFPSDSSYSSWDLARRVRGGGLSHLRVQTGDVVDAGASLNVDTDDRPVNKYIYIYIFRDTYIHAKHV